MRATPRSDVRPHHPSIPRRSRPECPSWTGTDPRPFETGEGGLLIKDPAIHFHVWVV